MGVKNSKWVFLHPILLCHIYNRNKMNQYSPLIQKGSRGCCCFATRPKSGAWRLSASRAGKRSSEPFKADTGDSGGRARGMRHIVWFQCIVPQNWSDYQQLYNGFHEHFQGSIFKREKGSASNALPDSRRSAEPTAFSRILTAFALFFAPVGRKKAVCQVCVYLRNRCVSHTHDSAKQADFSPVCGRFPCVRCTHKKSISLQPRG